MADARTHCSQGDLREGISRTGKERRRAVLARGNLEGHVLLGRHHRRCDGVRRLFRAIRAHWLSRPDYHPDHPETRLLLPMALRDARADATPDGNACPDHRAGGLDWIPNSVAVPLG